MCEAESYLATALIWATLGGYQLRVGLWILVTRRVLMLSPQYVMRLRLVRGMQGRQAVWVAVISTVLLVFLCLHFEGEISRLDAARIKLGECLLDCCLPPLWSVLCSGYLLKSDYCQNCYSASLDLTPIWCNIRIAVLTAVKFWWICLWYAFLRIGTCPRGPEDSLSDSLHKIKGWFADTAKVACQDMYW